VIDVKLLRGTVMSEWTKLRSVRSTYWCVIVSIIIGIGLGCAIAAGAVHSYHKGDLHDRLTFDPASITLSGLFFSQLALGVFAILTISAEYSTGLIRTTISAVPQRGYVLAAKAILVAVVSTVLSIGVAFIAFTLGQLILKSGNHVPYVKLSDPHVIRAVIGSGLYVGVLTLLALGLGTIIRHTAGAITGLVALVFIVPIVGQLLPDSLQHDIVRYLPAQAGGAITNVVPQGSDSLAPWIGFLVFAIWAAVALVAGWCLLRRRDV
jgi:ABC-2 type transport system permease protein